MFCVWAIARTSSRRCVLVVVGIETGVRWSAEASAFVKAFAHARARDAPAYLRWATALAWQRRWTRLLGTACANAFARPLVAPAGDVATAPCDGSTPGLSDLLASCGGSLGAGPHRAPLRE